MTLRPRVWTLSTAVLGGVATLCVMQFEQLQLAYRALGIHVGLEMAASFAAFLAAHLVYGRYRESGRIDDLALASALGVLAGANFFLAALPAAALNGRPERFSTWAPVAGRLFGEAIFCYAAFAPGRKLERPERAARIAFGSVAAALALIAVIVGALRDNLPAGIDPSLLPGAADNPLLVAPASLVAVHSLGIVLYATAAIGFMRRAERRADEFMLWLAVGTVLAALSRWNYLMFPSLYSPWVYTGDAFRLLSYVVLWIGAAREIRGYWRSRAERGVLEERRRLARELHDGLAQELGFIATRAHDLSGRFDAAVARMVSAAAERALDESRRAIAALTREVDEPLDTALAQAAEEVAARVGARLRLELEPAANVPSPTTETLLRIVREAVSNAGRHGRASLVAIELRNGDGLRLRVSDNGVGFDVDAPRRTDSFGLASMSERARALGGSVEVRSRPGSGTEVEVVLP